MTRLIEETRAWRLLLGSFSSSLALHLSYLFSTDPKAGIEQYWEYLLMLAFPPISKPIQMQLPSWNSLTLTSWAHKLEGVTSLESSEISPLASLQQWPQKSEKRTSMKSKEFTPKFDSALCKPELASTYFHFSGEGTFITWEPACKSRWPFFPWHSTVFFVAELISCQ